MSLKLGGSKSKTSSTSTSNSSSTTTPIVPQWASSLTEGVAGRVGGLMNLDPSSLVAPAHALQSHAAHWAGDLNGSPWNFDRAADLMRGAAGPGAFTYGANLGRSTGYEALGGQARGYDAAEGQAHGYDAAQGAARGYDALQGKANGYDAASFGGVKVGPAASVLDNLSAYYNPFRQQITDPVLADFDVQAGRTRAQQDLDLAGAGAFGGSGAALTKSMTEGELARARATSLSGLLNNMFATSAGMAESDAGRRQQSTLAQAGYDQETGLANMAALNRAREFSAGAQNDMAGRNLDAGNAARQFAAAADNEMAGLNLQALNASRQFGAAADNEMAGLNLQALNEARQFSAGAQNEMAGLNLQALNASRQFGAAADNDMARANLEWANRAREFGAAGENAQSMANQADLNEAGRFNAQAGETALGRQMDAARGLADLSTNYDANQRANIATQLQAGGAMRDIDLQQRLAPVTSTQQIVAILSGLPIGLFTGQQTTGTQTGSTTGKSSGFDFGLEVPLKKS